MLAFRLSIPLALAATLSACTLSSTEPTPYPGRTDRLADPGYIGANGALHKNVIAEDFFSATELAQMDLRGPEVIPVTILQGIPTPSRTNGTVPYRAIR